MATNVTPIRPLEYTAKPASAKTVYGEWIASGTLCGHIDFVVPLFGTFPLAVEELDAIVAMLLAARDDVVRNSNPFSDPRIYDGERP